jgi:hypothetical protein
MAESLYSGRFWQGSTVLFLGSNERASAISVTHGARGGPGGSEISCAPTLSGPADVSRLRLSAALIASFDKRRREDSSPFRAQERRNPCIQATRASSKIFFFGLEDRGSRKISCPRSPAWGAWASAYASARVRALGAGISRTAGPSVPLPWVDPWAAKPVDKRF